MAFNALVTVGGTELPEPSSYSGNTATLVDTGRNVEGRMIGAVIRDDVAKVELSWRYLKVDDWAAINKLFKKSEGGKFINSVTFFDQTMGGYETREMYVSDRSAGMWRRDPLSGDVLGWTDCRIALIET